MLIDNLFLSVGTAKAGTTWLYSVLEHHPDIYFSPEKELNYFAQHHTSQQPLLLVARHNRLKSFVNRFNPQLRSQYIFRQRLLWYANFMNEPLNDSWYVNLFGFRGQQKFCADFSNLHCQIDAAGWNHVKAIARNYRVLYILRDPLQRLWSHIRFHMRIVGKFDEIATWTRRDFTDFASQAFIQPYGEYANTVQCLRANVPPSNLKISFFEDVHADQRAWLRELEVFLGVRHFDYKAETLNRRINQGPPMDLPDFFIELFEDYARDEVLKLRNLGLDPGTRWLVSNLSRA